jgi:hypothetical protein
MFYDRAINRYSILFNPQMNFLIFYNPICLVHSALCKNFGMQYMNWTLCLCLFGMISSTSAAAMTCETNLSNRELVEQVAKEIEELKSQPFYRRLLEPLNISFLNSTQEVVKRLFDFEEATRNMSRPVIHGTTSQLLPTILSEGLKPFPAAVKRAASPQFISVSDLSLGEGTMTSYGYATRSLTPNYAVSSYKLTGRDVVSRLADHNDWLRSPLHRILLRTMARLFARWRGDEGFPVLAVYDASKLEDLRSPTPKFPAGLLSKSQLHADDLKYIFTPLNNIDEVRRILVQANASDIEVLPIEFIEIVDVATNPSTMLQTIVRKILP